MLYDRRAATHPRTPSTNATKTLVPRLWFASEPLRVLQRVAGTTHNQKELAMERALMPKDNACLTSEAR